jgi:hypothetical protein
MSNEELKGSMIYCNHSCEPNIGVRGNIIFVAMRDIEAGEELTPDHAMFVSNPNYSMICSCQTPSCRHAVTGNDWKNPQIQQKYAGYFSWYIEQKIKKPEL